VLSDELFTAGASYKAVLIFRIPFNEWIFMFKIRTEVTQFALIENAFRFFKSIRDQKTALGSLFQPITGKIPNTFTQAAGTPGSINGIFYAAGISNKNAYITGDDVGKNVPIPIVDYTTGVGCLSCLELFPNSTNVKPDFWID
jgi:hypothetical protein